MVVAKRQGREKPMINKTKEDPRTGVRTSGKTNNTPGWPNLHKTGPGTERHIKKEPKPYSLSLPRNGTIFSSRLWINMPSCLKDGFSCYYLNK